MIAYFKFSFKESYALRSPLNIFSIFADGNIKNNVRFSFKGYLTFSFLQKVEILFCSIFFNLVG